MNMPNINYAAAREEYLLYLQNNPGLIKVIEFGDVKAPGLSDIDWLIVYDKNKTKNKNLLLPRSNFSKNFKYAFQHRPIFLDKKYENYLGEFILPTEIKIHFGSIDKKEDVFKSIDPEKRNISIAFEFFKRQKHWLRKPIFEKLTFKKKVALFVSIYKHSANPFFKRKDIEWSNYKKEIDSLRISILNNKFKISSVDKFRTLSIKLILEVELILKEWILNNYENVMNKNKYYKSIYWEENIKFDNRMDLLVKSLKVFPILYKNEFNHYGYFFKKHKILKSICSSMKSLGLKDGNIADLGFSDWFPVSIRERIYYIKTNIIKYF